MTDDPKITKFPKSGKRRGMLALRPANDGAASEPALNLPPVVKALSLAIIAVFLVQQALPYLMGADRTDDWLYALAFVPARYSGGLPLGWQGIVSPVTHLFLHGGWLHLGVNLLSLMAFGAGLEKWLGGRKLLIVYFGSGFLGALTQFVIGPHIENPVIGASGAISGLFGALLLEMYARGYMGEGGGMRRLLPFVAVWIISSVLFGWFGVPGANGAIAWPVHVGGFVAGMALCRTLGNL